MRSIVIALAVWAFALAAPQAASATGARVENTQCFPSSIGSGYTACFTTKGATNETATPSGNVNYQFNGTVTFTIVEMVWYVKNDAAAGGNGTSRAPLNAFTTLNGAGGAGDVDDDVERAEFVDRAVDRSGDGHVVGDVRGDR